MPERNSPDARDIDLDRLKAEVRRFTERHLPKRPFVPAETPVPVSGKVYDHEEFQLLLEAALDGWWTEGRFTQAVAQELAGFLGTRDVMVANSGSSVKLLALPPLAACLPYTTLFRSGTE